MVGTRWLSIVLLVAAGTAQAQDAAVHGAPLPDTAQQNTVPPAAAQAPPLPRLEAQAPSAQLAAPPYEPAPAGVVPPQAVPAGGVFVPPYPGPVPGGFVSATQFVDYATWRLEQLTAREKGLSQLGRPDNYTAKRVGGFVMLGGGAATAAFCGAMLFLASALPHSGTEDEDPRYLRGFGFAALGGLGLAIGGAVWLSEIRHENPYRDEITQLHLERKRWSIDIKRARRNARLEQRMSLDVARLQVRF